MVTLASEVIGFFRTRRAFVDVLDRHGERLLSGRWRLFTSGLCIHERQQPPEHLRASRMNGDSSRRLYRWLPRVKVRAVGAGERSVTAVVMSRTGGELEALLFDWVNGVVHRVGVKNLVDPAFVERLELLGRYLPLAPFSIDDDVLSMKMIEGVALGMLPGPEKDARIIELIGYLSELARDSRTPDEASSADRPSRAREAAAYLATLDTRRLDHVPQLRCRPDDLSEVFGQSPWMLSHGDMNEHNVLLHDGRLALIDYAGCRPDAFWVDALRVIRRTAQRSFDDGRFDGALNGLWRAAGAGDLDVGRYRNALRAGQRLWTVQGVDDPVGLAARKPKWSPID